MQTHNSRRATQLGFTAALAIGLSWYTGTYAGEAEGGLAYTGPAHVVPGSGPPSIGNASLSGERQAGVRPGTVPLTGLGGSGIAVPSELPSRLRTAIRTGFGSGADELLLRNSDAIVRTKMPLALGASWHGFVYADLGATESNLRWQGLAGIHGSHGIDFMGGWRRVTYRFAPGRDFDSLNFTGPFIGATRAW
ncbi:MAG: hypothetical protein JO005_04210 [Gammaproteobacteria bacterium]|nr:hypothetical protein [Gammaproteobacteria bacterium]